MKIDRSQIVVSALLVATNVILFNLIVGHLRGLRLDLTEGDVFSLSETTTRILGNLQEPLELVVYVSEDEQIHEEIRPLLPEVRDLLEEYEIKGDGKVKLRFVVPEQDEAAEAEAKRDYGIRPQIGIYRGARQQGIQSFYLSLVVKYPGSDPVTLNADELITQNVFAENPSLELKNLELELTKAIKKAVLGFESKRNLFKKFPSRLTVTTFLSPAEQMPESLRDVPERIGTLVDGLAAKSEGKLVHVRADLADRALLDRERVPALAVEGREEPIYLAMIVSVEGRDFRVPLVDFDGVRPNEWIEEALMGAVKRMTPGLLRRIGIAEHMPDPDGNMRMMGRQAPPPAYVALADDLGRDHEVVNIDLGSLQALPADLDVLLVMEPARLDERAAYVLDQYVMGGGKVIFCLDRTDSSFIARQRKGAEARDSGLEDLLATWGVTLAEGVVLDPDCGVFFEARGRDEILEGPWQSLVEVGLSEGGVNRDVAYMRAFEAARFWFPGALELHEVAGLEAKWLLKSSERSFVRAATPTLEADLKTWPRSAFAPAREDEKQGRRILAAELAGVFPSHWAGKKAPAAKKPVEPDAEEVATAAVADVPIEKSRPTRVVVIANGEFLDLVQDNLARQAGPRFSLYQGNLAFLQNVIDWMLEDDDLATIRNRGRSLRPLERLEDDAIDRVILWNFGLPLVALGGLGLGLFFARRTRKPLI